MISKIIYNLLKINEIIDMVNDTGEVGGISAWDPEDEEYISYINGGPPHWDFWLHKNQGFFISIYDNVTICFPVCEVYNITL